MFDNTFTEIHHGYPTRLSRSNFKQPIATKITSFAIFSSGPKIWNNYLHEFEKKYLSLSLFLHKLKIKLLESEDELTFFWQRKLQLILTLSFLCFFTIGVFKYGCVFKLVLCFYVYIFCMNMYVYIGCMHLYIHLVFVCTYICIYTYILPYLFSFWGFLVIRLLKPSSSFQPN